MLKGEHRILGIRSPGDVCRGRGKPGILTGPGRPRGRTPGLGSHPGGYTLAVTYRTGRAPGGRCSAGALRRPGIGRIIPG
ncbi:hypothetical protein NH44784_012611 [Achromobacter xylosoxidans NH44784-1996]|nr:hypothetical protein NH44784_012611 [Achromobacter xylosoxidans NH44784-1996]